MFGIGEPARTPRYAYQSAVVRDLPANEAAVVMGSYLTCKGIHLPDDPTPGSLEPDARRFWDTVHEAAGEYYKDDNLAKKTAWKTTRLFYANGAGRYAALPTRDEGPITYIGNPGDLVGLGVCVEYTYIWHRREDGSRKVYKSRQVPRWVGIPQLAVVRFDEGDEPPLYWSPQTASLYVFPRNDLGPCVPPDPGSVPAHVFQTWSQRPPECARVVDVPEVDVQLGGNLDTIVYRDDKWHDRNPDEHKRGSQEYIHQFGDGVGIWQSGGEIPEAVVMTGGCLELDPRGLIH